MSIYDPVFSSSSVARAAGMGSVAFRAHLSRGNWTFFADPDVETSGRAALVSGQGHKFTIYDAMACALAKSLMDHGVEASQAFRLGMEYGHFGTEDRSPGDVFERDRGLTLYIYSLGAEKGQVLASGDVATVTDVLFSPEGYVRSSAIILNLNDLRTQVYTSLGVEDELA